MIKSTLKLTFLGTATSQGVPVIGSNHPVCLSTNSKDKRLRSSVYVEVDGIKILIDCGPDFRQQMLRANINTLDAIIFTHEHNDHVAGLDDIRPLNYHSQKDLPIYAAKNVLDDIRQRFPYVFSEIKYPGVPGVEQYVIDNKPFLINGVTIIPIPVLHGKSPIFGFRINDFVYITDASYISDASKELIKNADVLILNCLRKHPSHPSHFVLPEALAVINDVKPKKTYLTHISHLLGFHDTISLELPENVYLAFDELEIIT